MPLGAQVDRGRRLGAATTKRAGTARPCRRRPRVRGEAANASIRGPAARASRRPPRCVATSRRRTRHGRRRSPSRRPTTGRPWRSSTRQVERRAVGPAHELERRLAARQLEVEDLAPVSLEDAHRVEPPQDVPPAVDARQARVTAHGERHRTARGVDLVGELDAGRRRPDDQHAALGQARPGGGSGRHHLDDVAGQCRGERRARTARRSDRWRSRRSVRLPRAAIGRRRGSRRPARSTRARAVLSCDRRGERAGVALEVVDDLGHRHVPVGVGARVAEAGQAALPVRRQQPQRVPALACASARPRGRARARRARCRARAGSGSSRAPPVPHR